MGSQTDASAARLERITELAERVTAPAAADVDRNARFPSESFAALREARVLSAGVPADFGGHGASLTELAAGCSILGQHCSASAMVLAMHHIQVLCIARHGASSPFFRTYLTAIAREQRLIASVTSEVGIGGDMRTSLSAVETTGSRFTLNKAASTISYGAQADDLLITARRDPSAPGNDQVLVLVRRGEFTLERAGVWDTLGMRGTCSPGFKLQSAGGVEQILPAFGDLASATMVPVSHALWTSIWLGVATDAVGRARTLVRAQARKTPGSVPPTALRLAEVTTKLQLLRQAIKGFIADYEALIVQPDGGLDTLSSIGFALRVNQLKVSASELAVEIVSHALSICGIAGYRNDGPQSIGRHLRDIYSSILMIGNDRLHATNAALLLVHKGD